MRKSLKEIIILAIISVLLISYTVITYATDTEDSTEFFEVTEEITTSDKIEATINIENIDYDKFIFTLESTIDISTIEISAEENVELPEIVVESENKITIEIDKLTTSASQLELTIALPETLTAGDTVNLTATVTNSENEEEYETIESTIKITESSTTDDTKSETLDESSGSFSGGTAVNIGGATSFEGSADSNMQSEKSNMNSSNTSTENSEMSGSSESSQSGKETETATYNGSYNNYLSSLSIDSYELNKTFSKESTTYFITIDSDVDSLDITATTEDDGATVCIYGNSNLTTGENKILITVTAENGNTRTYRIYATKS